METECPEIITAFEMEKREKEQEKKSLPNPKLNDFGLNNST